MICLIYFRIQLEIIYVRDLAKSGKLRMSTIFCIDEIGIVEGFDKVFMN